MWDVTVQHDEAWYIEADVIHGPIGGAGGKGAWGVAGGEYDVEPVAVLNEKDPNYDPEEREKEKEKEKETPPVQPKEWCGHGLE